MPFDERDRYTGLAALHWATISETDSRWDQYFDRGIIEEGNGLALELGCGAGRLLKPQPPRILTVAEAGA